MSLHVGQGGDPGDGNAWYHVDRMGRCAIVHAGGEIDASTVRALDAALTRAASLTRHVVIDLAQVTFVDSSGLGALIVARRRARERGGSMSLVSPPPAVCRLLASTHLNDAFAIHDSLAAAIDGTA